MKQILKNPSKTSIVLFSALIFTLIPVLIIFAAGLNIENPLGETSDINTLVKNIINFLIILAVPITAILVVYAGFLYITSAGNDEKVKTAQKALIWAIIGFAIILVASSVPVIIEKFLSEEPTMTDEAPEESTNLNDSDISPIGEFPDEFYEDVLIY